MKKIDDKKQEKEQDIVSNVSPIQYQQSPKSNNYIMIALLMAVSFFAGYLLMKTTSLQKSLTETKAQQGQGTGAQQQAPPTKVSIDKVKAVFTDGFIRFGDNKSKVLIVEVTDPSCPYCHIAGGQNPELSKQANFQYKSDGGQYTPPVPEIRKLVEEGKASVAFIYGTGHGNGRLGMEAMYCAFEKGDFWPVHDKLMNNEGYTLLNDTIKNDRAQSQGLADYLASVTDSAAMKKCLDSAKYDAKLTRDEQEIANGLGFQGTPHFVVNETIVNGARDWKDIKVIVDPLL